MSDSDNHVALAEQSREGRSSTAAHTKGPLVARRINNDVRPFAVINPNGPFGDDIVAGYLSEADAHLYAAAPDMLAELKNCVWLLADLQAEPGLVQQQARAAIARATGDA